MSTSGLDGTGFKRARFADIFDDMEVKAKEVFGDQLNTSPRSMMGLLLRLCAWFIAILWQQAESVYYSAYKNTAEGTSLDRLGPYIGIRRFPEARATGTITLSGTPGKTLLAGWRAATPAGVYVETMLDAAISAGGMAKIPVRAVESGLSGNVSAGTITIVVNPDPDITSVTNANTLTGGREKETDSELRERWDLSVASGGAATVDSLRSAMLRTAGVRAAIVIENYTKVTDSSGRPPSSFEAYVLGGDTNEIGQTILSTKAAGIEPYGSTSVIVPDISGTTHMMRFSRAIEIQTHIKITLTKNSSYPSTGDADIRSAVVKYIGGMDQDGQIYAGLNMGDDVIISRIVSAAFKVTGVEDVAIQLSSNGTSWSSNNLAVNPQQVAQTSYAIIEVGGVA